MSDYCDAIKCDPCDGQLQRDADEAAHRIVEQDFGTERDADVAGVLDMHHKLYVVGRWLSSESRHFCKGVIVLVRQVLDIRQWMCVRRRWTSGWIACALRSVWSWQWLSTIWVMRTVLKLLLQMPWPPLASATWL